MEKSSIHQFEIDVTFLVPALSFDSWGVEIKGKP